MLQPNPYQTDSLPEPRLPSPGEKQLRLVSYLWLLAPPLLCAAVVLLAMHMNYWIAPGPLVFGIQLLLMSIGALLPSTFWGVLLAQLLARGSTARFIVLAALEVVIILVVWQQVNISSGTWR